MALGHADRLFKIAAAPSGLITEKTEPGSMNRRSAWPSAMAPPLPPSPTQMATLGVRSRAMACNVAAISAAMPSRSAAGPGSAPGVSTSVSSGSPIRSASPIARRASR